MWSRSGSQIVLDAKLPPAGISHYEALYLEIYAQVKVVAVPKAIDNTPVDTRPTIMTKRQPKRSATTPHT